MQKWTIVVDLHARHHDTPLNQAFKGRTVGAARQMEVPAGRFWQSSVPAVPARLGLSVKNCVFDMLICVYSCGAGHRNGTVSTQMDVRCFGACSVTFRIGLKLMSKLRLGSSLKYGWIRFLQG